MSARLKRNFDLLKVLKTASPKLRKAILQNSTDDLILCLCEVIANVLNSNVHLSTHQKEKLRKHRNLLRRIVEKRTRVSSKRKLFIQKGGFLPLLLAPILGIAGSLVGEAIGGAIRK